MSESNPASLVPKDYSGIITQMRRMLDDLQNYCPIGNNSAKNNDAAESEPQSTVDALPPKSEPINTPFEDDKGLVAEVNSQPEDIPDEVCLEAATARDALRKMCIGSNKDRISKMILDNTILSLPTGIKSLDDALFGGFRPGTIVFGGIPSCGKSTLALQLASQNAEDGCIVIYVSFEMSEAILVAKSIAKGLEQGSKCALPYVVSIGCMKCHFKSYAVGVLHFPINLKKIMRIFSNGSVNKISRKLLGKIHIYNSIFNLALLLEHLHIIVVICIFSHTLINYYSGVNKCLQGSLYYFATSVYR